MWNLLLAVFSALYLSADSSAARVVNGHCVVCGATCGCPFTPPCHPAGAAISTAKPGKAVTPVFDARVWGEHMDRLGVPMFPEGASGAGGATETVDAKCECEGAGQGQRAPAQAQSAPARAERKSSGPATGFEKTRSQSVGRGSPSAPVEVIPPAPQDPRQFEPEKKDPVFPDPSGADSDGAFQFRN